MANTMLVMSVAEAVYDDRHATSGPAPSSASVAIVTFGSLAGAILRFTLKAFKLDPAAASGPFVATLVDVSGIVIYFSIARLLFGTLL